MNNQRKLEAKIAELKRTIQFLCNIISNCADFVDTNPSLAKLTLKEALNDERYEYK